MFFRTRSICPIFGSARENVSTNFTLSVFSLSIYILKNKTNKNKLEKKNNHIFNNVETINKKKT
jgi:hypothetical protein